MPRDNPRRIYVRLDQSDLDQLACHAERARRHPADEAALIISKVLRGWRNERPTSDSAEACHVDRC